MNLSRTMLAINAELIEEALKRVVDESSDPASLKAEGAVEHVMQMVRGGHEALYQKAKECVLREKYPTLQQAWDHYQIVLRMCETEEDL